MKFLEITLPVHDPNRWTSWLCDTLGTPTDKSGVRLGWTRLRFTTDTTGPVEPTRGHHLAFAIPTGTIDDAAVRIEAATGRPLLDDDGTTVFSRGGHWASRSIYFAGPENSILELIEHTDRPERREQPGQTGSLLGVAEIGRGVPDVTRAGDGLVGEYGDLLPHGFGDPKRHVIAAYGDIDGAVVLARDDRPWYPTQDVLPATAPTAFRLEEPGEE